jgi:hypothetical protein
MNDPLAQSVLTTHTLCVSLSLCASPCLSVAGVLKEACDAAGIPMADAAMRWCKHHSILDGDVGDGIIFGASSSSHAEHNIAAYGGGPLPDSIVEAMDAACVKRQLAVGALFPTSDLHMQRHTNIPNCPVRRRSPVPSECLLAWCAGGRLHGQTPSRTFVVMARAPAESKRCWRPRKRAFESTSSDLR